MKKKVEIFGASMLSVAVLASLLTFVPQEKSVDVARELPDPPRMLSIGNEVAAELPDPPRMLSIGNEVAAVLPDPPRMLNVGNEVI